MYTIILDLKAEDDLDGIFNWYEEQRKSLGYEFLLSFEECLHKISPL